MAPIRVLLIEVNEDGTTGGSHQALLDLVARLDRTRWTPVVLCYQDNTFVARYRAAGAEVHTWDAVRRAERAVRGPWWMPWRAVTQPLAIRRRVRFLREQRIDIVHVNNSPSYSFGDWLLAARVVGVPCISHVRGDLAPLTSPARLLIPRFDRLIAISEAVESHIAVAGVRDARVTRVYDGIDAHAVRARVKRAADLVRLELGIGPDETLALLVGHLRPWKGQHVAIEAMQLLSPPVRDGFHLALAGAPDPYAPQYAERLRTLAGAPDLERRVHFLGARSDVPDLMNAADVVIHASTVAEPFGLVVVEAMALGRPIIASVLGGPGEIVTAGTGWTFDPAEPRQLATCIEEALGDPERALEVGHAAMERADAFSIEATVAGLERVYEEVLGRHAGGEHSRLSAPAHAGRPVEALAP